MTIKEQILGIEAGLQPWCEKHHGTVKIAHDVPHLFKVLGDAPGAPRAAILFAGDAPRNELMSDVEGRVDRKFWIAFSRGYTLERYPGKSLVEGIAGGGPMFELIDSAKLHIRTLRIGTDDEPMPYYKGTELLTFEGVTLDAYRVEIAVSADEGDLTGQVFEPGTA